MTKFLPLLLLACFISTADLTAQDNHFCGTKSFEEVTLSRTDISNDQKNQLIREHSEKMKLYKKDIESADKQLKDDFVYVIPVVFHIVHNFGPENISDAQVYDQLRVMNEEFRRRQASFSKVREEFAGIAGDCQIEFRLATITPDGNCTNGIHRYVNPNTNFTSMQQIQKIKPKIFWPTNKYLNCLIVGTIESSGGGRTLGYAQFPFFGSDLTDGLVMVHDGIGTIGTGTPMRSSVSTHEVGHWLGLYHTWGRSTTAGTQEACNDDDEVEDTPNTIGSPSVCDLNEKQCGPLANVQNYMDYSFCYVMFTEGQKERMHYFLNNIPKRKNMWQPENLIATGANYEPGNAPEAGFCIADFNHSASEPVCVGSTVQFQDVSFSGVKSWKWSFPGGNPSISTEQHPQVTYAYPGTYSVTLMVSDSVETRIVTKNNSITILSASELGTSYTQSFETLDLSTGKDFTVVNIDEDTAWQIKEGVGYSGTRSLFFHNFAAQKERVDAVESNTMDLSNMQNPVFTFKYAYTPKVNSTFDELVISVSVDCGKTWIRRKSMRGTILKTAEATTEEFVPQSQEDWAEAVVNISNYKRENLRIKFEWISGGGNNIYIDDINITDLVGIDESNAINTVYNLHPNPARDNATLLFDLASAKQIGVELYDLTGKLVSMQPAKTYPAGEHQVSIPRNDLAPGIYLLYIKENKKTEVRKLSFN